MVVYVIRIYLPAQIFMIIIIFMILDSRQLAWLLLLVVAVQSVIEINSNNNKTDFDIVQLMYHTCNNAPITNLGLCNNTCATCSATNSYACSSCSSYYFLRNQFCLINRTVSNYYYFNYFSKPILSTLYDNLQNFTFQDSAANIGRDRLLLLCSTPTASAPFEMFMFGLFKASEVVVLTYENIPNGIDRLYLKFNFLSVVQSITLYIDVNGQNYYKETGSVFSDLLGTYGINSTNNTDGPNYLNLNALSFSNPSSVIVSVSITELALVSQTIKIRFYANTPGNDLQFTWGMHDIVVIMRKCQTCVSKQLIALINTAGNITGILFAIVLGTVILLFIFIKIEEILSKRKFQQKLGTSSGNMPIKTLNRIINNIANQIDKNNENAQKGKIKVGKKLTNRASKDQ